LYNNIEETCSEERTILENLDFINDSLGERSGIESVNPLKRLFYKNRQVYFRKQGTTIIEKPDSGHSLLMNADASLLFTTNR